ncbi:MAG TPA: sensor domain-containing protein [Mycobacterium sp.]
MTYEPGGWQPPPNPPGDWRPGPPPYAPPPPPGWGPTTPRRRPAWRWWLTGAIVLVAVVAVVVGIVITRSSGDSATQQATATVIAPAPMSLAPVPISALDGLMPSPADIATELSTPPLVSLIKPEESHAFYLDHIVDSDCVGLVFAAELPLFDGSGWVSMRKQVLADTADVTTYKYVVTEAVVAFPDAPTGARFYHHAVDIFRKCANRSVNLQVPDDPKSPKVLMTVAQTTEKDGIVATSFLQEGGDGWGCQHGISVRNNIAIDTKACGYNMPDSATAAMTKPIASKIDSAG